MDVIAEAARQWRERWGAEHVPAMRAVTTVMRAQQLLMARLNDVLRPHGLTFPRYEALMLLSYTKRGELPLGKVGDRLQVHRTSAKAIVEALEAEGLVERQPHPTDGRTTLVAITGVGRRVAREATEALHAVRFETAPLDDGELATLSDLLARLEQV
ncbi:MAG TPA: MarR family transcriptional regulator [Gaiellaceae bacterium]|nr:MarR family transcriptional regulator [Gaiellaceae bacterium]